MKIKSYWIKERSNPQLGVYYVPMGQLSNVEAMRYQNAIYGSNLMLQYDSELEYKQAIEELKGRGEKVQ